MRERRVLEAGFIEVIVWRLPEPLSGSTHSLEYRLAYIVDSECVLRYDNEAGKGDHRHIGTKEMPYVFVSIDRLLDDFLADVANGRGIEMGAVTITVDSTESFKQRVQAAFAGKRQQERISFESFSLLWKVLAPNRMALVQTLTGAGPVTLREAARRVGRDVRAVHSDVHMLLQAGVLRKDDEGRIEFPYTAVHVDFMLKTAA